MEEIVIKELISRVNGTLGYYEKDYISVKRTPYSERERCETFEQFIEARFNYECCQIPELQEAVLFTEGHLFSCQYLENPDVIKRRFTTACIILDPKLPENLKNDILQLIGGSTIKFNNVKKKIKFIIE